MKILLDESVPKLVKRSLPSWSITTVQELGWSAIKNGELLTRAQEQAVQYFDHRRSPNEPCVSGPDTASEITIRLSRLRLGDVIELPFPASSL